jgi:hypothetical protein
VSRPAQARPAQAVGRPGEALQLMRLTTYELPDGRRVQVLSSPTDRDIDLLASR